jgi:hypothetical protein
MKGFRQPAESSKKEQLRELKTELANLQMSSRISQMMIQQMLNNNKSMAEDLGRALGLINELQYKFLAVQKVSNLDLKDLAAVADELRIKDFNEASDTEDTRDGFTVATTVSPDSTVILTSEAEGGKGIFRSRIRLADCGVPSLIAELAGKNVGDKVVVKLNELDHTIELLGVRNPKPEDRPVDVLPPVDNTIQPTIQ